MKNLKLISDDDLHEQTREAAQDEKQATLVLLEHLAEVDSRRLYSSKGFPSLWKYVHQSLGFSESQSSERVEAMRLMCRVPEVKAELASGEMTLTSVTKLAYHVKREKLADAETRNLVEEIKNKSVKEVERILVSESTAPAKPDRIKPLTQETTRILIDVDSEFMQLLERVKEMKGNPALSPQEVFRATLQEFVVRREVKEPKPRRAALLSNEVVQAHRRSRTIPAHVKRFVRQRSNDQCEYVDSDSKRRCDTRFGLQFDHARPFAKGGDSNRENIRHYCPAHNRLAAIREFGVRKMERYLRLG